MSSTRYVCVYCGSNRGNDPRYADAARALARALVARGLGLVYGGASVGIMGIVADETIRCGGRAIGVIPRALQARELAHPGLAELVVTESMHERKARMAELSAAFVALPGGIGTLEELFEIWTWAQLGLHSKPCALLDVAGYYAPLVDFLDRAVAAGFVRPAHRSMLIVESDPERLLERIGAYVAPVVEKWIEPRTS